LLWQALGLASGLAAVGTLIGLALPASDGGLVRSVLHAGALLRDGDVFGVAAMFGLSSARTAHVPGAVSAAGAAPAAVSASVPAAGSGGSWPAMILAVRLTCLAAGLALLTLLCWVLLAALAAALQARRRQRELLTLLAHGDPKVPGALVVDHPSAAAYCLPGLRSRIVVSVGTLELLGRRELAAVLAHERAHLRERHDLVLLPFTALRRAFPHSATCTDAYSSVALLVEMLADDRALRGRPARELVSALVRFGTAGTCPAPAGALAAGEGEVAARVTRLLKPVRPLPAVAVLAICLSAALLVAAPVTLLLV
jgi:Zn-dependent protease with chaperone function